MPYKTSLMDEISIERALKRISHEILEKNNGDKEMCIFGIKRRGLPLAQKIADYIRDFEGICLKVYELDITYYRDDLSKISDEPNIGLSQIDVDITNKTVILVDDVIYTGRTVSAALDALKSYGRAAKVQFAVLIDRGHRELPIRCDYIGKNVPTSRSEYISVMIPPYESEMCVHLCEL